MTEDEKQRQSEKLRAMTEEEKSQLKAQLLAELKDKSEWVAHAALGKMEDLGWLQDGSLRGADFSKANLPIYLMMNQRRIEFDLTEVDFSEAYLHEIDFQSAILTGARFTKASMEGAMFDLAHLENANFDQADLRGARIGQYLAKASFLEAQLCYAVLSGDIQNVSFRYANLQAALFIKADLRGADFTEGNLQGLIIKDSYWDESTILPNGNPCRAETDFLRFIDIDHPDFWRSKDPVSPAYQAKP